MVSYLITLLLGKPPEAVYQYQVPILSPQIDNLLFLNQRKREIFLDVRVELGTAA